MKISEARAAIEEQESEKVMQSDLVAREAVRAAEQDGIVFIDEIDKIVDARGGRSGGGVSSAASSFRPSPPGPASGAK